MNKMIFIASVLDPRNKFVYVSFALEELLGEETGNVVNTKVEAYLRDLFAIYVSKYGKGSKSQPSSSDSSDSSGSGISQNMSKNSLRTKLHMKKQKNDSGSLGVKSELDKYLLEDQEPEYEDFDILSWWKVNSPRFPVLSQLARDVLAIPMSSVASECAFSTGGRILDPFRSSLTPKCKAGLEKSTSQPTLTAVSSSTNGADTPFADITHFRSLIGALQYLAITRPDIQFAVNRVAQRMHQPSEHDYHYLKRILRYIFGTLGRGLLIRPGDLELRGFSDSDWASDKNDRKSTSGFLIFLGRT
uniref:HAT C-terminal dimerisation domain-containing protein n=1 Tax=Solanum lycopersicum TaxID=4081 RepID=A0A3Q7FMN0_SOLLC